MTDHRPITDTGRKAFLEDVGLPGYVAVVCVDSDGRDSYWLCSEDAFNNPEKYATTGTPRTAHERCGPLPDEIQARVDYFLTPQSPRCGRATKSGRPCRAHVHAAGEACRHHTATNKRNAMRVA